MPPKKRKAVGGSEWSESPCVFVLTSESRCDRHCYVNVVGCFNAWADVVATVRATMAKEPVSLFDEFQFVDEFDKVIHVKYLKKEWTHAHGLTVASISDADGQASYDLSVYRTMLQ